MRVTLRWLQYLTAACLVAAAAGLPARPADPADSGGFVAEIALDDAIGPASAEYVHAALHRARDDGARAVVLRLDTPGGLAASMHGIIGDVLASPIPVLGYVAPSGARAASAGTYILYACPLAAMAPATHLGAATPVALGGRTPMPAPAGSAARPARADGSDAESHKSVNDAVAYIRSLAQLHGRNADWAEQAVRGAATLTADEARRRHVVDLVADDVQALLEQADGRRIRLGNREVTLALAGLPVRAYPPGWRARFLGVITQPTFAYLLLLAGIYGLILEAFHPGALLPGIAGGICLLIGLYAMQLLPVNYAGLALMALGVGLVAAEVATPSVGALGIGGVIAFTVGSIMLFDANVPGYAVNLGVIAGLAFCAIATLGVLLWFLLRTRRARLPGGDTALAGAEGELLTALEPGIEGWARVHGERWRVRSEDDAPLVAGAAVRVVRRDGLLLWVASRQGCPDRSHP